MLNTTIRPYIMFIKTTLDITTLTIRSSWPMENIAAQSVVDTHAFVRHLLKRSRATRSLFN